MANMVPTPDPGAPAVPPTWGHREPRKPNDVAAAVVLSVIFTPLVGIIWGVARLPKNSTDGWTMITASIAVWVALAVVVFFVREVVG